ncbi:hypothetical protein [Micromonospora zhanjiangensis]|uniref:Uncharacterized protein n=1 Tax=Micromonospora zhanjiangensis TaxID=1522057 RepID=A0ABV8KVW8_9ACTN
MGELSDEIAEHRRRVLQMAAEVRQESIGWRHQLQAQMETLDEDSSGQDDQDDPRPAGAPAQYAAVRDRVSRGELNWFDVLAGRADDPDARAVHLWADARMESARQAWRLLEAGASLEEAVADVEHGHRGERR